MNISVASTEKGGTGGAGAGVGAGLGVFVGAFVGGGGGGGIEMCRTNTHRSGAARSYQPSTKYSSETWKEVSSHLDHQTFLSLRFQS
jgi:hypothetical protein